MTLPPPPRPLLPFTPLARVLVVDDYPEITEIFDYILAGRGYQTLCRHDGRSALEAVRFFKPHVILLNLGMPDMCGAQVLEHLRADPDTRGIKIILTTAHVYGGELAEVLGVEGCLIKPCSPERILTEVSNVLYVR